MSMLLYLMYKSTKSGDQKLFDASSDLLHHAVVTSSLSPESAELNRGLLIHES